MMAACDNKWCHNRISITVQGLLANYALSVVELFGLYDRSENQNGTPDWVELIFIYARAKLNNQKTERGLTGLQKISGITVIIDSLNIASFAWDGSNQNQGKF